MASPAAGEGDFVELVEGRTRLLVPRSSIGAKVPPKAPAFFNPAARLSRDISIIAYRAFARRLEKKGGEEGRYRTFADGFAGVGSRALRVAVEVPEIEQVYANDINATAIEAARKAAALNSVGGKCHFSVNEVCKFLLNGAAHKGRGIEGGRKEEEGERFGIVDLDPFGTPARHIDCVLRAVLAGGLISVTATDTAVLCGIYPEVCRRRYYGRPLNNSYGNETALRLLLSLAALTASRLELAIRPVFVHATMHYLRAYATVSVSSSEANDVYKNIGYVMHCFKCGNRFKVDTGEQGGGMQERCELCQSRLAAGGQLWAGDIYDKEFVKDMLSSSSPTLESEDGEQAGQQQRQQQQPQQQHNQERRNGGGDGSREARQSRKVIEAALGELGSIPYYFEADEISEKLKTNPHSVQKIVDMLHMAGFGASRTALNPSAFKTDARIDQILGLLKK